MDDILTFINHNTNLKSGDYVVAGISGGPDSMALLDYLIKIRQFTKINIVCAHIHHNLRKESDDEAIFVKSYCENNKIIFEMTKLNYQGKFTESLGHKMRYAFFEQMIDKYHAKYLFTAHHGDDLIETILMRLVRGSTLKGYAGFESISPRDRYTILRPLIRHTKEEILKYLESNNIPYMVDNSNFNSSYTRNRYRQKILPLLKQENKKVHYKFLQYSDMLNAYNDYVEQQVDKAYAIIVKDNIINVSLIRKEHPIIINSIIYRWLHHQYNDEIKLITKNHTNSIIKMLNCDKPNMMVNIPLYVVIKAYNKLYLEKSINNEFYEYILENNVTLPNNHIIMIVENTDLTNNNVTHLLRSDLQFPLYVRNFHAGDTMTIKNMAGHKKISDIFINEKIPLEKRSSYPVVVDSSGKIIWLPGIKKSAFDNKKTGKYDIILEYR